MQHISSNILPMKQSVSRGGRIGSSKLRASLEQCEDFAGLEEDTNRYDLLLLVKRVGKSAGFTPRMINLLDYYMSFTRDIDWEEGATPIIYQSISKTALDFGVSERQVQKLEKALFEIGAITWNDSGNHRRYGQRDSDTGMILYAYGVDLTPLAYLKTELEAKYLEKKERDRVWMEAKRQISWYRRQIKACLGELEVLEEEGAIFNPPFEELENSYNNIAVQIRTHMDIDCLNNLIVKHKGLYERVVNILEQIIVQTEEALEITNKSSCRSEQKIVHKKNTNKKQSNKLDTSKALPNSLQERSNRIAQVKKGREVLVDGSGVEKEEENPLLQTGLQHITLKQALNSASERFKNHLPLEPRPMEWQDFVEAAYKLKSELYIGQKAWANACVALGRSGAAICLLLTDQATLREENAVLKPAAYFNAMINRSKSGELKLHNSIFGILKRENEGEAKC